MSEKEKMEEIIKILKQMQEDIKECIDKLEKKEDEEII